VAARDFQALRWALRQQPTRPGAFTAQDIDRYVAAAAQPGALRAAVNYYRAAVRANPLAQAQTLRRVDIPTLVIWGDQAGPRQSRDSSLSSDGPTSWADAMRPRRSRAGARFRRQACSDI
jgi:pimeloyl-ACP methyl ester carboxylesterase